MTTPPSVRLGAGSRSDAGTRRRDNQDALLCATSVFLVSDGMGGHARGAEAARCVVEAFAHEGDEVLLTPAAVARATERSHRAVLSLGGSEAQRPGATVAGVGPALHEGQVVWLVFNIGDSRVYLLRGGRLEQVTVDHSRRQQLQDAGVSAEEAARRASANVITRAIGAGVPNTPQADQWLLPAHSHDRFLVCSDGVSSEISDQLIAATLLSHSDAQEACDAVVELATAAGGRDNATAVVVDAHAVGGRNGAEDPVADTLSDLPAPGWGDHEDTQEELNA